MEHPKDRWDKVQAEIAKRWVCLDLRDIEECRGDLSKLPKKIQNAYEWDFEDAVEDYQRFCDFVLKSIGIEACDQTDDSEDQIDPSKSYFSGTIEKSYFPIQNQKV